MYFYNIVFIDFDRKHVFDIKVITLPLDDTDKDKLKSLIYEHFPQYSPYSLAWNKIHQPYEMADFLMGYNHD